MSELFSKESIEETISKVNFILSLKEEEKTDDFLLKYKIKIIFQEKENIDIIQFPKMPNDQKRLLIIFVELIDLIFHQTKEKREEIYNTNIEDIKEEKIKKIFTDLEIFQKMDIPITKKKIENLYKIMFDSMKKNNYTVIENIESIFLNMAFFACLNSLLKFEIYSIIIRIFLGPYGVKINFKETSINIDDDISLDLILDLFNQKELNDKLVFQSLLILKYQFLRDKIIKCNFPQILEAIKNTTVKFKNSNSGESVFVEKISMMFTEEITNLTSKNKKKRKKKKNKASQKIKSKNFVQNKIELEKEEKITEQDVNYIYNKAIQEKNQQIKEVKKIDKKLSEENNDIFSVKIDEEISSQNKADSSEAKKESDCEIILRDLNINIGDSFKNYINRSINIILNMEDKRKLSDELIQLKNVAFNFVEDINKNTKKMYETIESMNKKINDLISDKNKMQNKIDEMQNKIDEMQNEHDEMKNEFDEMQNEFDEMQNEFDKMQNNYQEIRETLGDIQCRYLSKNFLKCFKRYLTREDFNKISNDEISKGKVISNRVGMIFADKCNKRKLKIVQNLIEKSFNLLKRGNDMAHSLIIDNYNDEIHEYKVKNNLDTVDYPAIFCFLIELGITEEYFEDSFCFLKKFFDNDLNLKILNNNYLATYLK